MPEPPDQSTASPPTRLEHASLRRIAAVLSRRDPVLRQIHSQLGPPPLWPRPASFATLVRIILEQQVSLASAANTFARLRRACGGRVTAKAIRQLGERQLRALGCSRQKARYAVAFAEDVHHRRFSIARLPRLSDAAVRAAITARLGMGDWTADVYLLMALRRPDIFPTADLALIKGLQELEETSYDNAEQLLARAQRWRPYRSVAARMIWQSYLHRRRRQIP